MTNKRRFLLFTILVFVAFKLPAKLRVEVSETVELTSILATLAGYDEYNQGLRNILQTRCDELV